MTMPSPRAVPFTNQRRSQRTFLFVPLRVSGEHANGSKFAESASTLVTLVNVDSVNANFEIVKASREGTAGAGKRLSENDGDPGRS